MKLVRTVAALLAAACAMSAAVVAADTAQATLSPNVTVTASNPTAGAISTLTYRATVTSAGVLHYINMALPKGTTGNATVGNGTLVTYAPGFVRWTPYHPPYEPAGARFTIPVVGFKMPGAGTYSLGFRAVGTNYYAPMSAGYGSLTLNPAPAPPPPAPAPTPTPAPGPPPGPVVMPPLAPQAWPEPPSCPASYPSIAAENAQPGTRDWTITTPSTAIAMYATATSAACGDTVGLRIDSSAPVTVQAFRMGYYGGTGARLVWTSASVPATAQPKATLGGTDSSGRALNEVDASAWTDSTSVQITSAFTPGTYLFKATDANGNATYAPLTVRDDTHTHHAVLLQQATATWQAYNTWGGADFYTSPGSGRISYDRPYDRLGAGQYLDLERGLVYWAEQHNVDVTYWTDEDMARYGSQIKERAAALWLPGHDEYYSYSMRQALTQAIADGVPVANFGANTTYRNIAYRSGMRSWDIDRYTSWPASSTWRWNGLAWDEQTVLGSEYGCSPSGTLTTSDSWLWAGVGAGVALPGFMNGENDYVHTDVYQPAGLTILGSATAPCNGWGGVTEKMDATAYTASSGAKVFDGASFAYGCFVVQQCPSNWGDGGATPTATEAAQVSLVIGNVARWQGVPFTNPVAGMRRMATMRPVNPAPQALPLDTEK